MSFSPNKKVNKIILVSIEILTLPIFFAAFALLYDPFHIQEYYSFGSFSFGFHITIDRKSVV